MTQSGSQLPLALNADPACDFASFVSDENGACIAALRHWSRGGGPGVIYLWGATGVGKSHLLQAAVQAADATAERAMYIPLGQLRDAGPAALDALGTLDVVALDELDEVRGDAAWEAALLALYQAAVTANRRLLWAGSNPPREAFALPDLTTRAAASLVFRVDELSEAGKLTLLEAEARRRGLELAPRVGHYIMTRQARDTRSLVALMARLDGAALSEGRRLTLPFVRAVLSDEPRKSGGR